MLISSSFLTEIMLISDVLKRQGWNNYVTITWDRGSCHTLNLGIVLSSKKWYELVTL